MYKSKLQELCQQRKWRLPEYDTSKLGLTHKPIFSANVTVNGQAFGTTEQFRSSKEAQNDAAKVAFEHFSNPKPKPANPVPSASSFPQPSFPGSSALPSTVGTDLNSTHDMNEILQPKIQETNQIPEVPVQFSGNASTARSQGNGITLGAADGNRFRGIEIQHLYKNQLQTYAQKRNLLLPMYSCEREGPPHKSLFKCKVTIDGKTFEGQQFLPSMKEAENAVAKAALMSLLPNGVKEDDSGLYKNLLQELIQKEGFSVPTYSTKLSGEPHVPIFVSTVDIEGESFTGQEARSKKQGEMSAAKVAYHTLRERMSSQIPLFSSIARQGHEDSGIFTSSFQSNLAPVMQQEAIPKAPTIFPKTIIQKQTMDNCDGGFSAAPPVPQNGSSSVPPSDCPNNLAIDPTLEPPAKRSMSSRKRVSVYPLKPNMIFPEGTTVMPMSDKKWVALSHT